MKSRSADKIQKKLVMLAYGATFSGKTTLGLQFAYFKRPDGKPFRLAVIDAEGGGVDEAIEELEDNGVDTRNIHIFYTQSLQETKTILSKIKNKEEFYEYDDDGCETNQVILDADGQPFFPDAVLLDGTSILKLTSEQGLLELSKKRNTVKADKDQLIGAERFVKIQGSDLEFKDYKALNYSGQNLVLDLMAIGINVFMTAREKDEKIQKTDSKGNQISVDTGRKLIDSFKGIDYNCKTVLHMYQDTESGQICAQVIKDRTKVHKAGEILEDPTLLDWEPVVLNNKGVKEFVLKNDLEKAVEIEQKMYEKKTLGNADDFVGAKSNMSDSNSEAEIKKYIEEIQKTLKSITNPSIKKEKKQQLTENNLPVNYKKVSDVEVLKEILEVVKN